MKRTLLLWVAAGVFMGFCFLLSLMPTYVERGPVFAVLSHVPFGWWHFLKRNLSELTFNWNTIATGIICSGLILVVGNWLLGALFKQIQGSQPDATPRSWRWRWTVCIYAGIWLLFAIAIGAAGVFQQTIWLGEHRQPWYEAQPGKSFEFALGINAIEDTVEEKNADAAAVQKSLLSETNFMLPRRTLAIEHYDVLLYKDGGAIAAFIIIPRRLPSGGEARFCVARGNERSYLPIADLQKTIAQMDATYSNSVTR